MRTLRRTKVGTDPFADVLPGYDDPWLIHLERRLLKMAGEIRGPWAYFVKSSAFVKIGHSRDAGSLRQRLTSYRVDAPEGARLIGLSPGGERKERDLHHFLKEHRLRGEWFRINTPVLEWIRYEGVWDVGEMTRGWPFQRHLPATNGT